MKTTERAKLNEKNCKVAANQLMYSLCALGVLKEPFSNYAYGKPVPEEHTSMWNNIITEIASDILMYNDEINNNGRVIGDLS